MAPARWRGRWHLSSLSAFSQELSLCASMAAPRVVVVGSGLAGATAALTAARTLPSAEIVVLEKCLGTGGNSIMANSINMLTPDQGDTPATFKVAL